MRDAIRNALRLSSILLYALWGRITRTREHRVELLESFTRAWVNRRVEHFDALFSEDEADFLTLFWSTYVGAGGREFAERIGREVDRKIRWKRALEGSPVASDPV